MIDLSELFIDGVCETERGWFAIVMHPGVDGNFADVYGEDEAKAVEAAEQLIRACKERGRYLNILTAIASAAKDETVANPAAIGRDLLNQIDELSIQLQATGISLDNAHKTINDQAERALEQLVRIDKLSTWARKLPEPYITQFFNILANGRAEPF